MQELSGQRKRSLSEMRSRQLGDYVYSPRSTRVVMAILFHYLSSEWAI